jgi:hypothetical protein
MREFNPTVILAWTRARSRYADALSARAHAKLGVETAARRPPRSLTEGLTAEQIERDARSLNKIVRSWKRRRYGRVSGTSTICLPSGRQLVYDWAAGEVVK